MIDGGGMAMQAKQPGPPDDARQHARARPLIACLQGLLAFDHRADEAFVSSGAFAIVKELAMGLGGLRPELLR